MSARFDGSTPTAATVLTFTGALLTVGPLELLIVVVPPAVLEDGDESRLTVVAYHARFGKPVVLMAQDLRGAPRYFGPDRVTPLVAATPFELIPWRQFRYRVPEWQLTGAAKLPAPYQLPTAPTPPVAPTPTAPPPRPRGMTGRHPPRVTLQLPIAGRDSLPTVPLDTMDLLTTDHGN